MPKVLIVGAGLVGSLLASFMARRGYEVEVFEKRRDPRLYGMEEGRSINLALSHRGLRALERLGLQDAVFPLMIPMRGRMIHDTEGHTLLLPYSTKPHEYINSISRLELNVALVNHAEAYPNVNIHFGTACVGVDWEYPAVEVEANGQRQRIEGDVLFAADGAGSVVRRALKSAGLLQEEVDFLDYGYKELTLPAGKDGAFLIEKHALHIWPRETFMFIALPNLDATFTCTLFLPKEGPGYSFEQLNTAEKVRAFFDTCFPDVPPLMPRLTEEYFRNPVGVLGTVRCYPWAYKGKVLLIGDAAHAIVPFYGQGMNAAFEDCLRLEEHLDACRGDWQKAFDAYQASRKKDTDAIADLAIDNFYEMRDRVNDEDFQRMRKLEYRLEQHYPDYFSKYALVTFHPEIPYSVAKQRGELQNKILLDICRQQNDPESIDLEAVYRKVQEAIEKLPVLS
ncbi:FAD-dependent oxidoreductase [Thermonema rossianum]|uniref:FAD-dependent oxidoreductase n=1 Tax=Thermonema rossianum TaxID=55505 RepID=UPI0005704DE8|nr:NAD(P)/FAD-dependent oxidoreductase [Thermonema rossianum]